MILITGGAGFLGSAILRSILKNYGDNVVVIDNFFRGGVRKVISDSKVYLEKGDVRDYEFVKEIFRRYGPFNIIIHAAWINGTKYFYKIPYEVLEVGILGTMNIVRMAKDVKPETFVFISSSEVYQDPPILPTPEDVRLIVPDVLNPRFSYGGGKIAGELLTVNAFRDSSVRWIIVRPHNIYGPDMGFEHVIPELILRIWNHTNGLKEKRSRNQIRLKGSGKETRSFCYIEDFVQGMKVILNRAESGIYNVGNDKGETDIKSLAEKIADFMGADIEFIPGDPPKGSPNRRKPDISKIRSLGFSPKWSLEKGLRETVNWYVNYLKRQGNVKGGMM